MANRQTAAFSCKAKGLMDTLMRCALCWGATWLVVACGLGLPAQAGKAGVSVLYGAEPSKLPRAWLFWAAWQEPQCPLQRARKTYTSVKESECVGRGPRRPRVFLAFAALPKRHTSDKLARSQGFCMEEIPSSNEGAPLRPSMVRRRIWKRVPGLLMGSYNLPWPILLHLAEAACQSVCGAFFLHAVRPKSCSQALHIRRAHSASCL